VDDALDVWTLFTQVVVKHVPMKTHRIKLVFHPEWLTPDILDAMKT
jgi:hypothetical protein